MAGTAQRCEGLAAHQGDYKLARMPMPSSGDLFYLVATPLPSTLLNMISALPKSTLCSVPQPGFWNWGLIFLSMEIQLKVGNSN